MLHSIAIVTKDNEPTKEVSDPEAASNNGLWHRGAHIALFTQNGDILVQKRSADVMLYPGMLDISVSGFVDSGETPEQAIVREVLEETGLTISIEQLQPLGVTNYTRHWQYGDKKKISRVFLYTYLYTLPDLASLSLTSLKEVEWIRPLPLQTVRQLVAHHHLVNVGTLLQPYSYYKRIVEAIAKELAIHETHNKLQRSNFIKSHMLE
jgi:isopentenyl-diphosphate delta-isomerase